MRKSVLFFAIVAIAATAIGCGKARSTSTAYVQVSTSGERVWCESGFVAKDTRSSDPSIYWGKDSPGGWQNLHCEHTANGTVCPVTTGENFSTRFQCFVKKNDVLLLACADKPSAKMKVDESFRLVSDGRGGQLCQID